MKVLVRFFLFALCAFGIAAEPLFSNEDISSDIIRVNKNGVEHCFVRTNTGVDSFAENIFLKWEPVTFSVFEQVKDAEGIAIDLGAWIGTTSIWLSKNFHHVVSLDCDRESVKCLRANLAASDCTNVTVCDKAISATTRDVVIGSMTNFPNDSVSYIKKNMDVPNASIDYVTRSITFKQMIYDYIYANEALAQHKIKFIKCDIEGGEDDIIEDLLYYCYYNDIPSYISFHLNSWQSKKISEVDYLFPFFKISCPELGILDVQDASQLIRNNPFCSLLFQPKKGQNLIKKNMPAFIIGYNQLSYIKNMVKQLSKYTSDITVIDNDSTFQPLLDYYTNEFPYTLLKQKQNFGHTVYKNDHIQQLTGDYYILTDPDLQFNSSLPDNFIDELVAISNNLLAYKVGFALLIDSEEVRTDVTFSGHTIKEWEAQFWNKKLTYSLNPNLLLYDAGIDTTFCLINRTMYSANQIRVAGDYTCVHIPWMKGFHNLLLDNEYETYLKNNYSTSWWRKSQ